MRHYTVTAPITLHAGVIGLSEAQAAPRMRSLEKRSQGGCFDIIGPVQFCAGEIILLDHDHVQPVVHSLLDMDGDPVEAEAAVVADPPAAAKPPARTRAKRNK